MSNEKLQELDDLVHAIHAMAARAERAREDLHQTQTLVSSLSPQEQDVSMWRRLRFQEDELEDFAHDISKGVLPNRVKGLTTTLSAMPLSEEERKGFHALQKSIAELLDRIRAITTFERYSEYGQILWSKELLTSLVRQGLINRKRVKYVCKLCGYSESRATHRDYGDRSCCGDVVVGAGLWICTACGKGINPGNLSCAQCHEPLCISQEY